jgi:hypothetical protein
MIDSKPTASTLIGVLPIGISRVSATKVPSATIAKALSQEWGSSVGDRQPIMSHGSALVSPSSLSGRDHKFVGKCGTIVVISAGVTAIQTTNKHVGLAV